MAIPRPRPFRLDLPPRASRAAHHRRAPLPRAAARRPLSAHALSYNYTAASYRCLVLRSTGGVRRVVCCALLRPPFRSPLSALRSPLPAPRSPRLAVATTHRRWRAAPCRSMLYVHRTHRTYVQTTPRRSCRSLASLVSPHAAHSSATHRNVPTLRARTSRVTTRRDDTLEDCSALHRARAERRARVQETYRLLEYRDAHAQQ